MAGGAFDRVGHLVRELVRHLAVTDLSAGDAGALAEAIEPLVERFDALPARPPRSPELPDLRDPQNAFAGDPVIGVRNPVAPPVAIQIDGDLVVGRVRLDRQYEGPPGHAHGGAIAAIFDMMLGLANLASGNPGMTGTLTIRYRNPMPLGVELVFEARTQRTEGRKVYTSGTAHAGDRLTAEAEGVFVSPSRERAAEYFGHTWGA